MISKEEVLKLAELARLKIGEEEIEGLQKDISSVLDYVGQVSAVEATSEKSVGTHHTVMREDVAAEKIGAHDLLLQAFPKREGDFNVVRKIIQKDE